MRSTFRKTTPLDMSGIAAADEFCPRGSPGFLGLQIELFATASRNIGAFAGMAPMIEDDFVLTLSDADEISDEEVQAAKVSKRKRDEPTKKQSSVKKRKTSDEQVEVEREDKDSDLESDFEFDNSDSKAVLGGFDGFTAADLALDTVAEIVGRLKSKSGKADKHPQDGEAGEDTRATFSTTSSEGGEENTDASDSETGQAAEDEDQEDGEEDGEEPETDIPKTHVEDNASEGDSEDDEDAEEMEKQAAFFAPEDHKAAKSTAKTFTSMSLSRPILKGLSEVGFSTATPIQQKTIPVALEGKDIVGGAVTGSGKTAAFVIPILERLLYRPKKQPMTRVAILMPTRELALQCLSVAKKLAAYTDITFGRAIGGLNSREQEKELKLRPDIVIATPGRFIDFMRNSSSFQVDKIEILVLDEADRMLEEGFSDELNEILSTIPKSRQTMLFSATMTSKVDDLIRVGLQRPVRLMVDAQKASASGLVQEFVRLRPGRESKRLGYLMHLCTEFYRDRVIIFFRQKKEAHRVRIIFALCGLKAAELHGSMSQEQRINAIESFRSGRASFLLATDLASRGLDIKGIDTVINYEAPQTHEIYLHRVGRTARAGRKGISCTIAAESDRKIVKAAVKAARAHGAQVRPRTIVTKDADAWQKRCDELADDVEAVLKEEKEEKAINQTEREITRAENVVKFEDEIKARPKKTWFESEKEKLAAKKRGAEALNGPSDDKAVKKEKKGKLSNKQKKRLQDRDDRKAGLEWKKTKTAIKAGAGSKKGQQKGKGKAKGKK
jgi:ATP-dependent RNA helicase DDX27